MNPFIQNLRRVSPRYVKRPVPWQSSMIHLAVLASLILATVQIFHGGRISRWSVGILYALYDSALILFTLSQILRRRGAVDPSLVTQARPPSATIVIACFNESAVLAATIAAVRPQLADGDRIVIADDGSTDGLGPMLHATFGLAPPDRGQRSGRDNLVWLRLDHGGKSSALNQALSHIETDLFLTVDADTILHDGALEAMKEAFRRDARLAAATGILRPFCQPGVQGRFFEFFQRYEYMRNFLSRSAWSRIGSLLLLSGAFAGYRTAAVKAVGGFDDTCIVEDYELTHRLMDFGFEQGLDWRTAIVGQARGTTMAPGTVTSFLHQRRRWFSGFLQTQKRYRHMVGNAAYGRIGTVMLPVKAVDIFQPVFGMTGFLLLIYYGVTANWPVLMPFLIVIACKLALDLIAVTAFLFIFDRWAGDRLSRRVLSAWLSTSAEPFVFQPLRHMGAIWGWLGFLSRDRRWKKRA